VHEEVTWGEERGTREACGAQVKWARTLNPLPALPLPGGGVGGTRRDGSAAGRRHGRREAGRGEQAFSEHVSRAGEEAGWEAAMVPGG